MEMNTCYGCMCLAAMPERDRSITEVCMKGAFGSERRFIENHPSVMDRPTVARPKWCKGKEITSVGGGSDRG